MLRVGSVVCLLVVVSAVAPAAGAASSATADGADPIVVDYEFSRSDDPDRVRVHVGVRSLPRRVSEFRLRLAVEGVRIREKQGFERGDGGLVWDGSTDRPTATYTAPTAASDGGIGSGDAANWTYFLAGDLTLPYAYSYYGSDPGVSVQKRVTGRGIAGASVVFLGRYDAVERRTVDGTVRLVVPRAANVTAGRETALASLLSAHRRLDVGAHDRRVNVFVATDAVRRGGVAFPQVRPREQDVWVRGDVRVNSTENTWVHEYVHTRQSFGTTRRMAWFSEASADYYAALLTLRQGRVGFDRFHRHVTPEARDGEVLTDRSTWAGVKTPYRKGRRVLAALDAHIRRATDGRRTLEEVFERLNRQDRVTYPEFVAAVNATAGTDLSGWLDAHVAGPDTPTVPDDPFAFTAPRPDADADGDGLPDRREAELGTDPFVADTDGDGLDDGREVEIGSDPTDRHSDNDRLGDGREVHRIGTDPTDVDTDGDGYSDLQEIVVGTDPTSETSGLVYYLERNVF